MQKPEIKGSRHVDKAAYEIMYKLLLYVLKTLLNLFRAQHARSDHNLEIL